MSKPTAAQPDPAQPDPAQPDPGLPDPGPSEPSEPTVGRSVAAALSDTLRLALPALGRWKIIYDVRYGFFELYDLQADRAELRNLADDRPRVLAAMKKRLFLWMDLWLNGFKTYPVGRR